MAAMGPAAQWVSSAGAGRLWVQLEWFIDLLNDLSQGWNFAAVGFVATYASALVGILVLLPLSLWATWSLARAGPARKMLTTVLLVAFCLPLYVVLSGCGLAIVWVVLHFSTYLLAVLSPILALIAYYYIWGMAKEFVEKQDKELPADVADVQDITCSEMLLGILMGLCCLCTFGLAGSLLTIIKAPVLLVSCMCQLAYHTFPSEGGCGIWSPVLFLVWFFALVCVGCVLPLGIAISVIFKLVASAVWPAYVTSGLLLYVGDGGRRTDRSYRQGLVQGLKAGYQVFWAADVLSNALILGRPQLARKAFSEFLEVATGQREMLSQGCETLSCLRPMVIGLFQGEWTMLGRLVARSLGASDEKVREAWKSFRDQMIAVGREALEDGLLTEDYVKSLPPELVIGLPARVLLDTVERSGRGEVVLASGLRVTDKQRPRGNFADRAWGELGRARAALESFSFGPEVRKGLCAALLAGGGDPAELPEGLRLALERLEELPPARREACAAVQQPLIGLAVECSRQGAFREQLFQVIQELWAREGRSPGKVRRGSGPEYEQLVGDAAPPQP